MNIGSIWLEVIERFLNLLDRFFKYTIKQQVLSICIFLIFVLSLFSYFENSAVKNLQQQLIIKENEKSEIRSQCSESLRLNAKKCDSATIARITADNENLKNELAKIKEDAYEAIRNSRDRIYTKTRTKNNLNKVLELKQSR